MKGRGEDSKEKKKKDHELEMEDITSSQEMPFLEEPSGSNLFDKLPDELIQYIFDLTKTDNYPEALKTLDSITKTSRRFYQIGAPILDNTAETYLPNPFLNLELNQSTSNKQKVQGFLQATLPTQEKLIEEGHLPKQFLSKFYDKFEDAKAAPDMHFRERNKEEREIFIFKKRELIGYFDAEGNRKVFLEPLEYAKNQLAELGTASLDYFKENGYAYPIKSSGTDKELISLRKDAAINFVKYRLSALLTNADEVHQLKQALEQGKEKEFKYLRKDTGFPKHFLTGGYGNTGTWDTIMNELDKLAQKLTVTEQNTNPKSPFI